MGSVVEERMANSTSHLESWDYLNGWRGGWKGFSILYLTDLKNRNNIRSDMLDSATILDITNNLLAEPIYI